MYSITSMLSVALWALTTGFDTWGAVQDVVYSSKGGVPVRGLTTVREVDV